LKFISSYASRIPFLAIAGNHDYRWDGDSNFRDYFPYNYKSPRGLYYSKDYYNIHLIFLEYYDENNSISDSQKNWINQLLISRPYSFAIHY